MLLQLHADLVTDDRYVNLNGNIQKHMHRQKQLQPEKRVYLDVCVGLENPQQVFYLYAIHK